MKHKHHIIPKHMGGTDDSNNLKEVTIEEHAQAHKELYERYGKWQDKLAWHCLSGQLGPKEKIIEELYKQNGKHNVKYLTLSVRRRAVKNARKTNTGRIYTKEHREKIRLAAIGRKQTDYQKQRAAETFCKPHIITDPKGYTFEVPNLRKWARENNLDQGNLTKVAQGKLRQHKGYKVRYK
jgi:hypothetical protein